MKLRSFKVSAGQAPVSKTGVAVARFGLIDRRTQEGSSRLHALLYACYPRLVNGYLVRDHI